MTTMLRRVWQRWHGRHAIGWDQFVQSLAPDETEQLLAALTAFGRLPNHVDVRNATYAKDGLITFHHSDFLKDPLFQEAYRLGKATGSWHGADIEWRAYVACWAGAKAAKLAGDFVECGVERGGMARAVMHYVGFAKLPKKFYLLDTFCGFPEEHRDLAAPCHRDSYHECFADAQRTFADVPNAVLVRGKVPESLAWVGAEQVAYLSIDMNCAEPEIAAAEHFWDKLVPGAVMLLDDYGYSDHYVRQKEAFNRFAAARNVQVLLLPTGQGLIMKP